ncbi:hypothetical protein M0D69_13895 [Caballeronia sp. SEWSISQ10-4 2]|uniref:hypothetical protein n=1 Tax=Caballeronia sp. SEWSISQ10-4 2 TaxID=2937438 RepID=UPI0026559A2A|nr:hypothetical protein [Caballeronia sp. SEWSISQ10-4 2]MDN7179086.1 hypothetical protein [Caballeronia sp. SEWSISQ10-4 2]
MASTVERKCQWCKEPFTARTADVKRGWARFCSKSCKASTQEKRNGQHRAFMRTLNAEQDGQFENEYAGMTSAERMHHEAMMDSTTTHGQDGTGGW